MSGTLPTELGKLTQLRLLKIVHTRFVGTIPQELFVLQNMEILHLTNNQLTGPIPRPDMPIVKELMIARNSLTGTLPTELGNLKKLENLEGKSLVMKNNVRDQSNC
jgi:hypothetical protein